MEVVLSVRVHTHCTQLSSGITIDLFLLLPPSPPCVSLLFVKLRLNSAFTKASATLIETASKYQIIKSVQFHVSLHRFYRNRIYHAHRTFYTSTMRLRFRNAFTSQVIINYFLCHIEYCHSSLQTSTSINVQTYKALLFSPS